MKLEVYAATIFEKYTKQQGVEGRWEYLSSSRKMAWIDEAHFLLRSAIQELSKSFKPIAKASPQASFEIGYHQGMSTERNAIISYIEFMVQDLEQQYSFLEDKYKN